MRIATVLHEGRQQSGIVDVAAGSFQPLSQSFAAIVAGAPVEVQGASLPLAGLKLLAPLPRPARNVLCVGKNYREHAKEFARSGFDAGASEAIPDAPILFSKLPEAVIGPDAVIPYPTGVSEAVDYEAELAVIIGKGGKGISRSAAARHVWGYTILNDVTARDWQARHKQWFLGKSFDGFCPMGPWAVSADEIDAGDLAIRCWVNDELRQDARTSELIFDIPTLIETISAGITLYPGDIIATGTPQGVGVGFSPPRYLKPGDTVRIGIAGIGELVNRVG